jgi:hypothetical protein
MTQVLITSSGSGTWTVPANCPAGTTVNVEGWGGGGGGGSRSSGSAFGSGGGGGAYVNSVYQLTPNDITNGVPYVVAASAAGGSGGDGTTGNATTWSTNNLNLLTNSSQNAAAVGTLPTNWTSTGTPAGTIVGVGFTPTGMPYIDVNWTGTTSSTHCNVAFDSNFLVSTASTAYCGSAYIAIVGGSLVGVTSYQIIVDDWTAADAFIAAIQTTTCTITPTLTRFSGTGTTASTGLRVTIGLQLNWTAGTAINVTLRIAGAQIEAGSSPSAWKSTPGYLSAPGGSRSNGASGGAGGVAGTGNGSIKNTGGAGVAYASTGAGGGGAAGPDANGTAGSGGAGGQGDGTTGGAGGAVSSTSPANAGTASTSGGGGGGSLTTVGGSTTSAGAGGAPGGGGGGAVFWNGSSAAVGGAGAIGQLRITYYATNLQSAATSDAQVLSLTKGAGIIRKASDAQSVSLSRPATHASSRNSSSPEATNLIKNAVSYRTFTAASAQSIGMLRALFRSFGMASVGALSLSRGVLILRQASDTQSASVLSQKVRAQAVGLPSNASQALRKSSGKILIVVASQAYGLQNLISVIRRIAGTQSAAATHTIGKPYHATSPNTPGLIRHGTTPMAVGASGAQLIDLQRIFGHFIAALTPQNLALQKAISMARSMASASGIAATTFLHRYIPLAQRNRVVRLPPSGAISTLPPAIRIIVIPREEAGVLDYQIHRSEPEFFSPFDPGDQQTFTFDWSVRGYANDAIIAADIIGTPHDTGFPDLNFIGPTFIDSYTIPNSNPPTLGYLVSVTVGEFEPLSVPTAYTLRCSVTFASGRIGNWSVPFQVRNL